MQHELETLQIELEESKDKYLRLLQNLTISKRSVKERFELMKTAAQETLTALLPVLDDFDRAKKVLKVEMKPSAKGSSWYTRS